MSIQGLSDHEVQNAREAVRSAALDQVHIYPKSVDHGDAKPADAKPRCLDDLVELASGTVVKVTIAVPGEAGTDPHEVERDINERLRGAGTVLRVRQTNDGFRVVVRLRRRALRKWGVNSTRKAGKP